MLIDLAAVFRNRVRDSMFKTVYQRLIPTSNTKLTQLIESPYMHNWIVNRHRFMDFVAWVFLYKCTDIGIKFLQLKYRIPASATHPKRITVGQHYLDSVGYAEDLVLCFEDITNLELALDVLSATFKRYQLEINISETKMMIFNQYLNEKYPKPIVSINNTLVENTIIFKYLGCNMKNDKPPIRESELEIHINTPQCKFYEFGKKLTNFKIMFSTGVKILKATYAKLWSWQIDKLIMLMLYIYQASIVHKMVKRCCSEKHGIFLNELSNEDILWWCDTKKINHFITQ